MRLQERRSQEAGRQAERAGRQEQTWAGALGTARAKWCHVYILLSTPYPNL